MYCTMRKYTQKTYHLEIQFLKYKCSPTFLGKKEVKKKKKKKFENTKLSKTKDMEDVPRSGKSAVMGYKHD